MEKVYKHHVKDISELRKRIVAAWDEFDQRILDIISSCLNCAKILKIDRDFPMLWPVADPDI